VSKETYAEPKEIWEILGRVGGAGSASVSFDTTLKETYYKKRDLGAFLSA
jgi:predicted Zn-dependent peptidase